MNILYNIENATHLEGNNKVLCNNNNIIFIKSKICFIGKNNILEIEDNVKISCSNITFNCNNSHIYISKSKYEYCINIFVYNNCNVYFGKDCFFHNKENLMAVISENTDLFIGNDCLFSYGVVIRTSDAHAIYSINNGVRINKSKKIIIGDHVWIGQETLILKGSIIGSGSILGARSLIANSTVPSNTVFAGIPAKRIRSNIFWRDIGTNEWDNKMKNEYNICTDKRYIYNDKIDYINTFIKDNLKINSVRLNKDHYRFSICTKSSFFKMKKIIKKIKKYFASIPFPKK